MELTRKQVINTLETLKLEWGELAPPEGNICDALDYAISSLKTDEAYQLMYEGGEVFSRAYMIAMLTEIQLECEENTVRWYVGRVDGKSDDVVLMETLNEIIQQKINALKGDSDGA